MRLRKIAYEWEPREVPDQLGIRPIQDLNQMVKQGAMHWLHQSALALRHAPEPSRSIALQAPTYHH